MIIGVNIYKSTSAFKNRISWLRSMPILLTVPFFLINIMCFLLFVLVQFFQIDKTAQLAERLVARQVGAEGMVIGTSGVAYLASNLLESDNELFLKEIIVDESDQAKMYRSFTTPKNFQFAEKLQIAKTVILVLPNSKITGIVLLSNRLLGRLFLWSFLACFTFVLLFGFVLWLQKKQLELSSANEQLLIAKQVAHDIRSPLSALNLVLKYGTWSDPSHSQILNLAIDKINQIAGDLLERARRRSERLTLPQTFESKKLIDEIVAEKKIEIMGNQNANIEFRQYTNCVLNCNRIELGRVLSNLLNNAIEATSGFGSITIETRQDSGFNIFVIKDSGKGMAKDILAKVGQFGASFDKVDGHGMGLFHAKRFAQKIGGYIEIQSEEGKGTTVSLSIPIHTTH